MYIDDCCKDYPVSIYNKFIDSSIKTLPYRSKIKIGDTTQGNILRIFTCAKFNTYNSSINSKAYFFTNDFKFKYAISKGSKKNGKYLQCSYNGFENSDESYEYFDFDYKKVKPTHIHLDSIDILSLILLNLKKVHPPQKR